MKQVTRRTTRLGRLCSLVVLLALVLRVLYVPYHLAQDGHVGTAGHVLAHVSAERAHAALDRNHDDGHDHGGREAHEQAHDEHHVPHPALDHATELIVQRNPSQSVGFELAVVPVACAVLPVQGPRSVADGPDARPPKSRQGVVVRSRGPPARV